MSPLLFKSPLPDTINFTLKPRHSVNFSPIQTQMNLPAEEVEHKGDLVHVPTDLHVSTAWHNQFHSETTSFCQLQPYTDTTEPTCRGSSAQRKPWSCPHCSSCPHCLTSSKQKHHSETKSFFLFQQKCISESLYIKFLSLVRMPIPPLWTGFCPEGRNRQIWHI